MVALAESLGQRWLAVSGLLAGLLIGVAGAAVGKAKSRREARREAAEWARLFRVQAAPVAWRRSTRKLIGVDAAPPTALGEEMPDYVPRGVDDKLRAAVEAALATDDGGAWLVVVSGPSKVGKSRSLR